MVIHEFISKLIGKEVPEGNVNPVVRRTTATFDGYVNGQLKKLFFGDLYVYCPWSAAPNDYVEIVPGTQTFTGIKLSNKTTDRGDHVQFVEDVLFNTVTITNTSGNAFVTFIGYEITIEQ